VDHWENCLQDARTTYHYTNDMMTNLGGPGSGGDGTGTFDNASTTGTVGDVNAVAGHQGIEDMSTGGSNTGLMNFGLADGSNDGVLLGAGDYWRFESDIKTQTLSTATQRYTIRTGFSDTGNADPTNGCIFKYSDNVNGGKWQGLCANGGTTSTCDVASTSGTTVATSTWYRLTIQVNSAGTAATFQVNGSNTGGSGQCQVTTNIPTGNATAWQTSILKSAGTVPADIYVDYVELYADYGTSH
jgi:hypothetical protein